MRAYLIDSNIIAHWVLAKRILKIALEALNLPNNMILAYEKRYSNSVELIDKILHTKVNGEIEFLTFDFNLFEVVKALKDEIRTMYLFNSGVPLSKWNSRGEHAKIEVSDELIDTVFNSYNEAQDELFEENRISIISHPFSETGDDWETYFSLYSSVMLNIPSISTQDALIISACLYKDIGYLITKDKDLKRLQAQISQIPSKKPFGVKIIDPGDHSIWK
jgi:hypothetical protein